jgi:hypothetical protein
MVRRMIEAAQRSLIEGTMAGVKAGFQAGLTQQSGTQPFAQTGYGAGQTSYKQPIQPV